MPSPSTGFGHDGPLRDRRGINRLSAPTSDPSLHRLVSWSLLITVPVGLATTAWVTVYNLGVRLTATVLPGLLPGVDPRILTVIIGTLGGLGVGLTLRRFGPRHGKSLRDELQETGRAEYRGLLGYLAAAFIGLSSGASLGPEAPLSQIGAALGTRPFEGRKLSPEPSRVLSFAGIAAAFGSLFGFPLSSTFMTIEFFGMQRFGAWRLLIVGAPASLVGFLIFFGITGGTLAGNFSLPYTGLELVHLAYAIAFGVLGVGLAFVFKAIHVATNRILGRLAKSIVPRTTVAGFLFGVVGAFLPLTLYSGEKELHAIVDQTAVFGVVLLAVMALAKMFTLSLCESAGFPGGPVFPLLFVGGVIGIAFNALLPAVPFAVAFAAMMAATFAAVGRMPIAGTILITLITNVGLGPVVMVSSLTAYLLVLRFRGAGNAQDAHAESETKSAVGR